MKKSSISARNEELFQIVQQGLTGISMSSYFRDGTLCYELWIRIIKCWLMISDISPHLMQSFRCFIFVGSNWSTSDCYTFFNNHQFDRHEIACPIQTFQIAQITLGNYCSCLKIAAVFMITIKRYCYFFPIFKMYFQSSYWFIRLLANSNSKWPSSIVSYTIWTKFYDLALGGVMTNRKSRFLES